MTKCMTDYCKLDAKIILAYDASIDGPIDIKFYCLKHKVELQMRFAGNNIKYAVVPIPKEVDN